MKSIAFGLAAWIALLVPAHAQEDAVRARTYHRSTAAGKEVRVLTYVQHRSDCSQGAPAQVDITTAPAHGSVDIRSGSVKAGPSRFGAPDCSGRMLSGPTLWYTPAAGYVGTDQFEYEVRFNNGTAHDTAVIEVN